MHCWMQQVLPKMKSKDALLSYMKNELIRASRAYAPFSRDYFPDAELHTFLPAVTAFPPYTLIPSESSPTIRAQWTVAAWVMVDSPSFVVRGKTMDSKGDIDIDIDTNAAAGRTCWQVGPAGVIYGSHEGRKVATLVGRQLGS
jgi:hypothetical protein